MTLPKNILHSSHLPCFKSYLNPSRMNGCARQKIFDKALGELSSWLVVFLHDRNHESWLDVFANGAVHRRGFFVVVYLYYLGL